MEPGWRAAYRTTTGGHAAYLNALRVVVRYYGNVPIGAPWDTAAPVQLEAWMLQGFLLHARISALVAAVPVEVLAALAVVGQPGPALRQAVQHPLPWRAANDLVEIATALQQHGNLLPPVIDLAIDLADAILDSAARSEALAGIAALLAAEDSDRATTLAARALQAAENLPEGDGRSRALAAVVEALACHDPDSALRVANTLPEAENRSRALAAVAQALASYDLERATELITEALRVAEANTGSLSQSLALGAVVQALAPHNPDRALQVANTIPDEGHRSDALTAVAEALGTHNPERATKLAAEALLLAETLPDSWNRRQAQTAVVRVFSLHDPERALQMAETILKEDDRGELLGLIAGRTADRRWLLDILCRYWSDLHSSLGLVQGYLLVREKNLPTDQLRRLALLLIDALAQPDLAKEPLP
jgi:hypothetical protein